MIATQMSETAEFRADTRAWLQENCPPSVRGAGVIPRGSRKVERDGDQYIFIAKRVLGLPD
jgi:hypothetical protein